jgi:GTP cyclohydrolase II
MADAGAQDPLIDWLETQASRTSRPLVTLTFAQSLDGSLGAPGGQRLALSGPESLRMTHQLRAWHDAILVGIGTVLADNPSLTVRLVAGSNPRPVVLDTRLRMPIEARLLQAAQRPIIFTAIDASPEAAVNLRAAGAEVIALQRTAQGSLDLEQVLAEIHNIGLHRLMVEGGARVLRTMLASRLGDVLIVTIAPRLVAGIGVLAPTSVETGATWPELTDPHWAPYGTDGVFWARLEGPSA